MKVKLMAAILLVVLVVLSAVYVSRERFGLSYNWSYAVGLAFASLGAVFLWWARNRSVSNDSTHGNVMSGQNIQKGLSPSRIPRGMSQRDADDSIKQVAAKSRRLMVCF